jgi:uncharacterized protein YhjY with autotransporter beta-barrel domain
MSRRIVFPCFLLGCLAVSFSLPLGNPAYAGMVCAKPWYDPIAIALGMDYDGVESLAGNDAFVVGTEGGPGNDIIVNDETLLVTADAIEDAISPSLTAAGNDEVEAKTTLESDAVGIAAGSGRDRITNTGAIDTHAASQITSINAELNLVDTSHGDASTSILSNAKGVEGEDGHDHLTNTGTISADAVSSSQSVNMEVNRADAAQADASLAVESSAVGIDMGRGRDVVTESGTTRATARSTVDDFSLNASFVDVTIADREGSDTSTTLNATATGIRTGEDADHIATTDTAYVEAVAVSDAHSTGVAVASEGVPGSTETLFSEGRLSNIGITGSTRAVGMDSGPGNDRLDTMGGVTAHAASSAAQESINVGVALLDFKIPTPGIVLGGAGTKANADAEGITTGEGHDEVNNGGPVNVEANAAASATTVSANFAEFSIDLLPDVPGVPFGASLVAADTSTVAGAEAAGIVGGTGNDFIQSTGPSEVKATSIAGSTSASASLDVKYKEGDNFLAADAIFARAETEATSSVVGIDGGEGKDELFHGGNLAVGALSDTTAVSVGVGVAGTLQGKGGALGLAATDTSNEATADAVGITGGDDKDRLLNAGTMDIEATTDIHSGNASVTVGIAKKGLVAGAALSRSESTAAASAVGIEGGDGADRIGNTGDVGVTSTSEVESVALSATIEGTAKGLAAGAALARAANTAEVYATGIDGGEGRDEILNTGSITAGSTPEDAEAMSKAVATSVALTLQGTSEGLGLGAALTDTSTAAVADTKGIDGGEGADEVTNTGDVVVDASSLSRAASVSVGVGAAGKGVAAGAAMALARTTSEANATGIDGGESNDTIVNAGWITAGSSREGGMGMSKSVATSVAVDIKGAAQGVGVGAALADSSAAARAAVRGVDGGRGNDRIVNTGRIRTQGSADAEVVSVSAQIGVAEKGLVAGAALARSTNTAGLYTAGIDGGKGDDLIINEGPITVGTDPDSGEAMSNASATSVAVDIKGAVAGAGLGAALTDASTTAISETHGIAGGEGRDEIRTSGDITVYSSTDADATSASVSVGVVGGGVAADAALARAAAESDASAAGIHSGAGSDLVCSSSEVKAKAASHAVSKAVGVSIAGTAGGGALGAALTDGSADAVAIVGGIAGGSGGDVITSREQITVDSAADSETLARSIQISLAAQGIAAGGALSKTTSTSDSRATGISGDTGDDAISNYAGVGVTAKSDAVADAISVSLNGTMSGTAAGAAVTDASAKATSYGAGIGGGEGDDAMVSSADHTISAGAESFAKATSVSVEGSGSLGLAAGASISDASATAESKAAGIDGGPGRSFIRNDSEIETTSTADAEAGSTSVVVSLGTVAGGFGAGNSSATAAADSFGIAGGTENDRIVNAGRIDATSSADADAASSTVKVGVALGASVGAARSDASTTAEANTTGILGGLGNDLIWNTGAISAGSTSTATASSNSLSFDLALGLAATATESDASALSRAFSVGIDGGGGADTLFTQDKMIVNAVSESTGSSVTKNTNILPVGAAFQSANADSSSTAQSVARGIDGGTAGDTISAKGTMEVAAESRVIGLSRSATVTGPVGLGITLQESQARTETVADALAVGIAAGEGDDTICSAAAMTLNATSEGMTESVSVSNSGFNLLGASFTESAADASTSVESVGIGVESGEGADTIVTRDTVSVAAKSTAVSSARSSVRSSTFIGAAKGKAASDSSARVAAQATGIDSGDGGDRISNLDRLQVRATSEGTVITKSNAVANVTFGKASTKTAADASGEAESVAAGIAGGGGNDFIESRKSVDAIAEATLTATLESVSVSKATFGNAYAAAASKSFSRTTAASTGMAGGEGNDWMTNTGSIGAGATATTDVKQTTVAITDTTFGTGNTVANASTAASGEAAGMGMAGGPGCDVMTNDGLVAVEAGATVKVDALTVSSDGPATSDGRTMASAYATGIAGGGDQDRIRNKEKVFVKGAPRIEAGFRTFGDKVDGTAQIEMEAEATGVAGGEGDDVISNEGESLVFVGRPERESTATEGGPSGTKTFIDAALRDHPEEMFVGKWIRMRGEDGSDFLTRVERFDPETGRFTLSDPIKEGVTAGTRYTLYDSGDKAPDIAGVTINVGGRVSVDASTNASIRATGIDGGQGRNEIWNRGTVEVRAGNLIKAGAVTVGGKIDAELSTRSLVEATGIAEGGGKGRVVNLGEIGVAADAAIDADGWVVDFGGRPDLRTEGRAQASSTGVQAGAFQKAFENSGRIAAQSTAEVLSKEERVEVTFFSRGGAEQALAFRALSDSTGISIGAADDPITNGRNAAVDAEAVSAADVEGVTTHISFIGIGEETNNSADARATSTAMGLDIGEGCNTTYNAGKISGAARADAKARAVSDGARFNETNAAADATAMARVSGIRTDRGKDTVINTGLIAADASVLADTFARGADIGGTDSDLTSTVTEEAASGATAFTDESLKGKPEEELVGKWVRFLSGKNEDFVSKVSAFDPETGTVTLSGALQELEKDDRYTVSEARSGTSGSVAQAFAAGIDLGESDRSFVLNTDRVQANASAQAISRAETRVGSTESSAEATAEARGIVTGDGNDSVENKGVISATAEVGTETTANGKPIEPVEPNAFVSAVGIWTQGGDDRIVNRGRIETTEIVDGVESAGTGIDAGDGNDLIFQYGTITTRESADGLHSGGTAIRAGAGDDTVFLSGGSETDGNIELGPGRDIMNLYRTPVVHGAVMGGGGTDSLVFNGAGSFTSPLQGFETAVKQGWGRYSVSTLPTMRHLQVDRGALQISSDYAMSPESTFQTQVNPDGTSGQLQIGGTAALDGGLVVVKGRGRYLDGATYEVLTADRVEGAFARKSLPDSTPLMTFSVEEQPTAVRVHASVNSFRSVARRRNNVEWAVAGYLDRILPTATGDFSELLGSLQSLPNEAEIERAVTSLGPGTYGNATTSMLSTVQHHGRINHERMASLRTAFEEQDLGGEGMFLPGFQPILFSSAGAGLAQTYRPFGFWMTDFDDSGKRGALDGGYQSFNYDTNGFDMGFDVPLGERSFIGTSFASASTDMDLEDDSGDGEIDSLLTSLYGNHFFDNRTYVESLLSFGDGEFNQSRTVEVGSGRHTAFGTHNGRVFSAFVQAGRVFGVGAWRSEVFGALDYVTLYEEGFEEGGEDDVVLLVDERRTHFLRSELGFQVGRAFQTNLGRLMSQLRVAWAHDFGIDDRDITARLADVPGEGFTVQGERTDPDALLLDGALTLTGSRNFALSAGFDAELRSDDSEVSGLINLKFRF